MPEATTIQIRNKAMISLQGVGSLRISELRTVKIKNLIQEDDKWFIHVNPRDMEVKGAKTRNANFMQLPPDILENLLKWKNKGVKPRLLGIKFASNKRGLTPFPHFKAMVNFLNMIRETGWVVWNMILRSNCP